MNAHHPVPRLPAQQLAIAWQSASLLLGYPDEPLRGQVGLLRDATRLLPAKVGSPLRTFLDYLEVTPPTSLAARYVETFDHQRRCCLYLTYFTHGDTRKRGMALLALKTAYQRAGLVLEGEELPDHLSVVLEFAAAAEPAAGWSLLLDHRAGVELLRIALRDSGSPWASVLEAVSATLPPLRGDECDAVRRLAAEGPPGEEVGLAPFAPPEYMPVAGGGSA